ncbi:MAG: NADH-quinone oxidoreductase subunit J [Candidatus Zixiibacteriota bacterium]
MLSETASLVFWVIAFVTIMSAILVVSLRNIFHSALFLVLCLFAVAGIFILCEAEFLAGVQVLIYAGGIAVLMIFAVMLTTQMANYRISQQNEQRPLSALVAFCFLLIAVGSILKTLSVPGGFPLASHPEIEGSTTHTIGQLLLRDFVLPFELVSVVLLVALIGAVVLAKKDGE